MDQPRQADLLAGPSSRTISVARTATDIVQDTLITPPPELRLRDAIPEPQAENGQECQQASQSAQQAQQSASQAAQQASQSIQQASQQASQAAQQASQSASRLIGEAQNSATQAVAAASRSASAAFASASSMVSSVQSSASQAIASANGRMSQAQASASTAQAQASSAVLQAGAAVAAATGSAGAAGSSFLQAAAEATQSADASIAAIGAQASNQVQQAGVQVTASQIQAVTATQAALAIVGSIIASALITILIYFLVTRQKKKRAEKRSGRSRAHSDARRDMFSPRTSYTGDSKFASSDQDGMTVVAMPSAPTTQKDIGLSSGGSHASFSLFPKATTSDANIKTTSVKWNPSKPPKAPRLQSWLNVQEVSPFGPIKLPTDKKSSKGPMGGQLRSPMGTYEKPKSPTKSPFRLEREKYAAASDEATKAPFRLAKEKPTAATETAMAVQVMAKKKPVQIVQRNPSKDSERTSPENLEAIARAEPGPVASIPEKAIKNATENSPQPAQEIAYQPPFADTNRDTVRESKASSVWTDEIPYEPPSPPLQSAPKSPPAAPIDLVSVNQTYPMQLPEPEGPIRNTAEWFAAQARTSVASQGAGYRASQARRMSQYPRLNGRMGLPSRPGPDRAYGTDLNGGSGRNDNDGDRSSKVSVGKAL